MKNEGQIRWLMDLIKLGSFLIIWLVINESNHLATA